MGTEVTLEKLLAKSLASSGQSARWAEAVSVEALWQSESDTYRHARHALLRLAQGDVHVLTDNGATTLDLGTFGHHLAQTDLSPAKAATSLVLAAVAVGGAPDGKRPAWQHVQDTGNVTRGGQKPSHPVRRVGSPSGARALYNLAIGQRGAPGTVATQARGFADRT